MKETHYFYAPEATLRSDLPEEEAAHAVRVLRMKAGDEIALMDGRGSIYRAVVTETTKRACFYSIEERIVCVDPPAARVRLAVAPTKNMDRMEWLAEKATEIGVSEIAFMKCRWSERTQVNMARIEKIVVSAMKQSHQAWKPELCGMGSHALPDILHSDEERVDSFIAHCRDEADLRERVPLREALAGCGGDVRILIGPEGDFSHEEVAMAEAAGAVGVSLGESRLRTETAALVAVMLAQLHNNVL